MGKRLALIALAKDYKKKVVYSGPLYNAMKVKNGKVIISFKHSHGGLVAKGGALKEFTIAGKDQKFIAAKAEIINSNTITVWNEEIKKPVAVRYGWRRCPIECNLYNAEGLPASLFRTDDFPLVSRDRK